MPHDLLAQPAPRRGSCPRTKGRSCTAPRSPTSGRPGARDRHLLRQVRDLPRAAAARPASTVFTLDHHRGSEENQAGLGAPRRRAWSTRSGLMDTLPVFRRTIAAPGWRTRWSRSWGVHHGRRALAHSAGAAVHRRRPRRGARAERLLRVRPLGPARRCAGHPRRLRATRGRRPGAVPRLAAGRRQRRVRRRSRRRSMRVLRRTSVRPESTSADTSSAQPHRARSPGSGAARVSPRMIPLAGVVRDSASAARITAAAV